MLLKLLRCSTVIIIKIDVLKGGDNISRFKDLTDMKFGRLTVIKRVDNYIRPSGKEAAKWLCVCDCGNKIEVITNSLTSGSTKSCGCLHNEK